MVVYGQGGIAQNRHERLDRDVLVVLVCRCANQRRELEEIRLRIASGHDRVQAVLQELVSIRIKRSQDAQHTNRLAPHRHRLLALEDLDKAAEQPRILQIRIRDVDRVRRNPAQCLERRIAPRHGRMRRAARQLRYHQRHELTDKRRQFLTRYTRQLTDTLDHARCHTRMRITHLR